MFLSTDEVPLSQTPDGYRHTSSLLFPKKLAALDFYLPSSFATVWIILASLGIIGGGIFQGATITSLLVALIVGFLWVSVSTVHGVIQREMSHLLGYTVSFDLFLLFRSGTYIADPGQFQSRRDGLLIACTPLSVSILFLLPLLVLPSGVARSVLVYVMVMNALGSAHDLYACWRLCKMAKGTLLYIESLGNILVLEPTERVKGHQKDSVLIKRRYTPVVSTLHWKKISVPGDTRRKEIPPEDEDILVEAFAKQATSRWNASVVRWITRLRANDSFELSTTSAVDFTFVVRTLIDIVDEREKLFDLKFSDTGVLDLVSVRKMEDTQLSEEQEEEQEKAIETVDKSHFCEIKAVVGAGFLQLTPAVVTILLERVSVDQTQIEIKGVAKETWIKQHAAEKAALAVSQWCEDMLK